MTSTTTPRQRSQEPPHSNDAHISAEEFAALEAIQRRVLWLSTQMIHHANYVRPNPDGGKIGGHQASSASLVSVLTVLYLCYLRPGDRVSVKPHASPVFHSIQYLLGQLPQHYLTTLRSFGGLQAYPSRTKDPDHVDFSTGSVGLGAVAPAFAALAARYAAAHFNTPNTRRFVSLVGDAELDEGNVWEAVIDPALTGLENLLWIVDLNRQSLDRVVPGIRAAHLKQLFAESGWQVLETKYGRQLQAMFERPDGSALRTRIDEMPNEEYQALIRLTGNELRPRLVADDPKLARLLAQVSDDELPGLLANLGGHDLAELLGALRQADAALHQPTIIFAYTIKGWGLPIAGHPQNHAMLLTAEQIESLRTQLGVAPGAEWDGFAPDSPEGRMCAAAAERLYGGVETPRQGVSTPVISVPETLDVPTSGSSSTQETFGRIMTRLADVPELRERIVTASPDVSVSTNLSGWITKTGMFSADNLSGQHIELGISEMNLFMLLGIFGLSTDLIGEPLIPVGTVYDPFICRGLDALIYGLYGGARFIIVGTPSGITLAPEGGAHQSTVTASLGMELPNLDSYEPCFAQELAWIMPEAIRQCYNRSTGRSSYLRLSTRAIDQSLLDPALTRFGPDELRRQVLRGGYRLIDRRDHADHPTAPIIHLAVSGAMVPETVAAAAYLRREGVAVNVLNLTSPRRLYEAWRGSGDNLDWLILPDERNAPIVTVHDAASHALAWIGSVHGAPVAPLGVDGFGQSGERDALYHNFGIATEQIIETAFDINDNQ
jgi:pyruvate dehydrogenase E1 component